MLPSTLRDNELEVEMPLGEAYSQAHACVAELGFWTHPSLASIFVLIFPWDSGPSPSDSSHLKDKVMVSFSFVVRTDDLLLGLAHGMGSVNWILPFLVYNIA